MKSLWNLPGHPFSSSRTETKHRITFFGELAQLGERLVCNQEVTGSSPVFSTSQLSAVSFQPSAGGHGDAGSERVWKVGKFWNEAAARAAFQQLNADSRQLI